MSLLKPHQHLLDIVPYVAGESSIPGIAEPLKLSSNESPLGPSTAAIKAFEGEASDLERYPDGGTQALRDNIGRVYDIDPDCLVCSNGSEQLIDLLARCYAGAGDEVVFSQYSFISYRIAAIACGAKPVVVEETDYTANVDALLAAITEKTKVVFLANPNNPTGTYLPKDEVRRLREGLPEHVLLVIDAAYGEYVSQNDYDSGKELVDQFPTNTVMIRTFSKIYALAALRIGWCYANQEIIQVLNRVRGVFNVSTPAQAAAIAALNDVEHVEKSRSHNNKWLPWLSNQLTELGLKVTPSLGNFVLIHFAEVKQCAAANEFLRAKGIILRPVGGYGLPQCLRATIGLEHENEKIVAVLKEFLQD